MPKDNVSIGTASATFRPVAYFSSQQGGMSLVLANRDDADDLEYRVESAAGPGRGLQTADWRAVDVVQTGIVEPGTSEQIHDVADDEDFRQFRLLVRGAGVKYLAVFGEPTGAQETETDTGGGQGEPRLEVIYDADLDLLTVTSIGNFLDFNTVEEVWFVNGYETPYDIWVEDTPTGNGFVRQSADVITLEEAAYGWLGPYDPDEQVILTELTFYSEQGTRPDNLVATWEGEVDMTWTVTVASSLAPSYDPDTDQLTIAVEGLTLVEGQEFSAALTVKGQRAYEEDFGIPKVVNASVTANASNELVLEGASQLAGFFDVNEGQILDWYALDLTLTDSRSLERGSWTGAELMLMAPDPALSQIGVMFAQVDPQVISLRVFGTTMYRATTMRWVLDGDEVYDVVISSGSNVKRDSSCDFYDGYFVGRQILSAQLLDGEDSPLTDPFAAEAGHQFPAAIVVDSPDVDTVRLTGTRLLAVDRISFGSSNVYYAPTSADVGEQLGGVTINSWTDTEISITHTGLPAEVALLEGETSDALTAAGLAGNGHVLLQAVDPAVTIQ